MIGVSRVGVDSDGNNHIKNVQFPATKGLWEILTRKRVDKESVSGADLKQYKTILEMTYAHSEGYKPHANIRNSKGLKYREVISKFFPSTRQSGAEVALRREWVNILVLPCCGDCTPILQHRQRFSAYTSFNRQLDMLLPVKSRQRRKRQVR